MKEHVGMATIADDRLDRLAVVESSAKITPATIRVVDVPGTGPALLGNLRRSDALLAVVRDDDDLEDVDGGGTVADWGRPPPPELEPLTTKPLVVVVNGARGIDLELEEELAQLDDEEAAAFREGASSALEEVV